jgi:hypothetical protein
MILSPAEVMCPNPWKENENVPATPINAKNFKYGVISYHRVNAPC